MADYTVIAHVHQKWVPQFNKNKMKFCFATAVDGGGGDSFNVVAFADNVGGAMTCKWTESYDIAASKDTFADGVTLNTATNPTPIKFGQTYGIDSSWADSKPSPDKDVDVASFRFRNKTIASAVVYKIVNGNKTPVYISAAGPLPPGTEDLTPRPKCRLWFSAKHDTRAMISKFAGEPCDIDLTGKTLEEVWYNHDGFWYFTKPADFV